MRLFPSLFAVAIGSTACDEPADYDGVYAVDSYTQNEEGCGSGTPIESEFPTFEIRGRNWLGAQIYPVYPCDENGESCAVDNHTDWNLVVEPDDLDNVSMTMTWYEDDGCALVSEDKVIEPGGGGSVVLQRRMMKLLVRPYDASTCTTDEAEARHDEMECATLIELVGVPFSP